MTTTTHKQKGPAAARTAPDHGPTNPGKEKEMNVHTHTTNGINLATAIDDLDAADSLVLAAHMACSDLDNEPERSAIKEVLYAARQYLADVREKVDAANTAAQEARAAQ